MRFLLGFLAALLMTNTGQAAEFILNNDGAHFKFPVDTRKINYSGNRLIVRIPHVSLGSQKIDINKDHLKNHPMIKSVKMKKDQKNLNFIFTTKKPVQVWAKAMVSAKKGEGMFLKIPSPKELAPLGSYKSQSKVGNKKGKKITTKKQKALTNKETKSLTKKETKSLTKKEPESLTKKEPILNEIDKEQLDENGGFIAKKSEKNKEEESKLFNFKDSLRKDKKLIKKNENKTKSAGFLSLNNQKKDTAFSLKRYIMGMAVFFGFLFLGLKVLKSKKLIPNFQFAGNMDQASVNVLEKVKIAPKQTLLIVKVMGQKMLLSQSDSSCNFLCNLPEDDGDAAAQVAKRIGQKNKGNDKSQNLMAAVKKEDFGSILKRTEKTGVSGVVSQIKSCAKNLRLRDLQS